MSVQYNLGNSYDLDKLHQYIANYGNTWGDIAQDVANLSVHNKLQAKTGDFQAQPHAIVMHLYKLNRMMQNMTEQLSEWWWAFGPIWNQTLSKDTEVMRFTAKHASYWNQAVIQAKVGYRDDVFYEPFGANYLSKRPSWHSGAGTPGRCALIWKDDLVEITGANVEALNGVHRVAAEQWNPSARDGQVLILENGDNRYGTSTVATEVTGMQMRVIHRIFGPAENPHLDRDAF